jgi:formylglycine-generating enzyme required for sulfatase activity
MERKISSYQQRLRQTIDTKKEGLARIKKKTKGIQERFSPQIIEAEQNLTRFKRTKLSFIDEIQSYFSPKIKKKRAEKEKTLEGEWIRLGKERDEVIIKENERVREEQEKIHSVYERNMEKVQGALEPLLSEYKTIEEKFFAYGDLNPRLLGFRAKKQFSIATIKIGTVHVDMKLLPSGMFYMGDERTLNPDPEALPLHEVSFKKPFWMSATPITQECYRSVIGKNPSSNKNPKNPVEMVSWFDAIRFCNILSLREKLQPVYEIIEDDEIQVNWQRTASGYRLATEAEWEYAARASSKFLYSGSARAGQVAWFHGNSDGTSHVVAKKGPNDWGLYDLSGNLWEWCWDLKGPYKKGSSVDPIGAKEGNGRVFRGGSYLVKENILMVYHRGFENPNVKSETVGFRVVRDPR